MRVELGTATTAAERQEIFRLRYAVYIEEMKKPYAADHEHRLLFDAQDEHARLLYARVGSELVATLRLNLGKDAPFSAETSAAYDLPRFWALGAASSEIAVLSRLMVRADHRSGRLTVDLLAKFAEVVAAEGVELVFLQCHPHLVNFYCAMGFRASGPAIDDKAAGILVPMVLLTGDAEHLQRLRSPITRGCAAMTGRPELRAAAIASLPAGSGARVIAEGSQSEEFWDEVSVLLHQPNLTGSGILDGLSEEMIRALFAKSLMLECKDGDTIIRRGQTVRTVYIVLSGRLEVVGDGIQPATTVTEGDVVGEIAFLLGTQRTRDVRAVGEGVRVLALSESSLRALIDADSRGAALLLLNLARALAAKIAYRTLGQPS